MSAIIALIYCRFIGQIQSRHTVISLLHEYRLVIHSGYINQLVAERNSLEGGLPIFHNCQIITGRNLIVRGFLCVWLLLARSGLWFIRLLIFYVCTDFSLFLLTLWPLPINKPYNLNLIRNYYGKLYFRKVFRRFYAIIPIDLLYKKQRGLRSIVIDNADLLDIIQVDSEFSFLYYLT